ncbi:PREDICTED: acetylcholinesterase-like [Priapulus caudatus]|uniref:Carboxylic ester hydrolase n=1 Tax=Priapulus caudatus TaxID=37621 RepID=A0ABM1E4C8_PRICU|nr:PREDICTED: acetylcholinesterase-like [Priapulus caudatus]
MQLPHISVLGWLFVLISNSGLILSQSDRDNTRRTTAGSVRGFVQEILGKRVNTYFGIPFARPPVGELRFREPTPPEPWRGVRRATTLPNSCAQAHDLAFGNFSGSMMWNPNTNVSEDCLYLNVWAPAQRPGSGELPVIVWIYGGGYMSGTSSLDFYMAHNLAAFANIVVISIQYRLGAFGFLYLGTDEAPGNMGLLDQTMALRWIRDNAREFGGDPDRVTIIGESAGSSSVSHLLLSPVSRDLFSQAVMQSAVATSPFAYKPREVALQRAEALAEDVGCFAPGNVSDTTACLRRVPTRVLISRQYAETIIDARDPFSYFPFTPTLDDYFIREPPQDLVDRGDFKKTRILIGSNKDEGSYFLLYSLPKLFPKSEHLDISREQYAQGTTQLFSVYSDVVVKMIAHEYSQWPYNTANNAQSLSEMLGDYEFTCPVIRFAEAYAKAGLAVYQYYFTHRSANNPWPTWGGVMHGYEIDYILGLPLDSWRDYTEKERNLSMTTMKYFSNFVKSGDPNRGDMDVATQWPKHTIDERYHQVLSTGYLTWGTAPRMRQCDFWREIVPSVNEIVIQKTGGRLCPRTAGTSALRVGDVRRVVIVAVCILLAAAGDIGH